MKKLFYLLLIALMLVVPFTAGVKAEEKEKINVYLFRGEGCPHCAEAEEFFDELAKDEEYSAYYNLVDFEVWYDEENANLMEKVAKELGTEAKGVPFIVIGDKFKSGFASSMKEDIKELIKTAYEDEKYKDVVARVQKGESESEEKQSSAVIPIVIVSVAALAVVVGMVFFTKEK